jgi:hypothetical protein
VHLSHKIAAFLQVLGEEELTGKQVSHRLKEQGLEITPRQATEFMNYNLVHKYLEKRKVVIRSGQSYHNVYRVLPGVLN